MMAPLARIITASSAEDAVASWVPSNILVGALTIVVGLLWALMRNFIAALKKHEKEKEEAREKREAEKDKALDERLRKIEALMERVGERLAGAATVEQLGRMGERLDGRTTNNTERIAVLEAMVRRNG